VISDQWSVVSGQFSVFSFQFSVFSFQWSVFSGQFSGGRGVMPERMTAGRLGGKPEERWDGTKCFFRQGRTPKNTEYRRRIGVFLNPEIQAKEASFGRTQTSRRELLSSQFSLLSSHFSVLTSQFSLLSSHFSVLTSQFSLLRGGLSAEVVGTLG